LGGDDGDHQAGDAEGKESTEDHASYLRGLKDLVKRVRLRLGN
jgi:hypothetical protein